MWGGGERERDREAASEKEKEKESDRARASDRASVCVCVCVCQEDASQQHEKMILQSDLDAGCRVGGVYTAASFGGSL